MFLLCQSYAQVNYFYGKWVNDQYGIQIDTDKVSWLIDNVNGEPSKNPIDIFKFVGEPRINELMIFETWVQRIITTKQRTTIDTITKTHEHKEYSIMRMKLKRNDKLELYFSPVMRSYTDNRPAKWFYAPREITFPTKIVLKRYRSEKS